MSRVCNCAVCVRHREIDGVVASRDPEAMAQMIGVLENALGNVEMLLDVDRAILDGSWPSAVEDLERALEAARSRRAEASVRD